MFRHTFGLAVASVTLVSMSASFTQASLPLAMVEVRGPGVLAVSAVTVTGRITDASTGRPLAGAQVSADGTGLGALTNSAGRYALSFADSFTGREVTVRVQLIGYASQSRALTLAAGANALDFSLTPVAVSLDELVVTGVPGRAATQASAYATARTVMARAERPNREAYAFIDENDFVSVADHPLSTFALDVDRASYSNVRRLIAGRTRPPIDAVRIEELVNYFPYADPAPDPSDDAPLFVSAEVAPAPWQPSHQLVRIGVKAREIDMADAPPNNLVFLVDVSGSMWSPDKLPLLKTALAMLVGEMRTQDRIALVVYAGAAGLVLPSTPGSERETILDALEELSAGGSTAGGAGIRLAYDVARQNFIERGNNRVILATDGDFNVGPSSDAEMIRLIEEKREEGTFLTVLGFGTGNLQDAKMEQIADHGNGQYAYIDSELEAKKVMVAELGGTLVTVAKDAKIQVEFNPTRVAAYRLIGYENRLLADEDFNDDRIDAGDIGAGHTVTALYEIVPSGLDSDAGGRNIDPLRYQRAPRETPVAESEEILFVKLRYKEPDADESRLITRAVGDVTAEPSDDFRFSAAVAAWGMLLRDSEHCGDFSLDDVITLARGAVGLDPQGYRAGFVTLAEQSRASELLSMAPGRR